MGKHNALPSYEVEFIPLERRLREDRRRYFASNYSGPERRLRQYRRTTDTVGVKPRQPT